ncbi:uncharacterized protein LOC129588599 [Paramacrobiotus metropolitanus]|uniref:uncharacterized protein LOC129588599 n=1 Tax=Paramacrobiotus metropolitanus TaxID=2943436 RepID=UPI0024463422|nr:uncharacterized protein LOC129588599 [Paramacrobiotus metropolitanus]
MITLQTFLVITLLPLLGHVVHYVLAFIGGYGGFGGAGLGLGYGWWGGYPGFGFPWLAPPLSYQINTGSIYGSPGIGYYNPGPGSLANSYIDLTGTLAASDTSGAIISKGPPAGGPPGGAPAGGAPAGGPAPAASQNAQSTPSIQPQNTGSLAANQNTQTGSETEGVKKRQKPGGGGGGGGGGGAAGGPAGPSSNGLGGGNSNGG